MLEEIGKVDIFKVIESENLNIEAAFCGSALTVNADLHDK